jgi:hypothetical protein
MPGRAAPVAPPPVARPRAIPMILLSIVGAPFPLCAYLDGRTR